MSLIGLVDTSDGTGKTLTEGLTSPPAIGDTTPNTGAFTSLTASLDIIGDRNVIVPDASTYGFRNFSGDAYYKPEGAGGDTEISSTATGKFYLDSTEFIFRKKSDSSVFFSIDTSGNATFSGSVVNISPASGNATLNISPVSTSGVSAIYMGDTSTPSNGGIYYNNSADFIVLRSGGGDRLTIDSSGNSIFSGYIGVTAGNVYFADAGNTGITNQSGDAYLYLENPSSHIELQAASGGYLYVDASSHVFRSNDGITTNLMISTNGNTMINTVSDDGDTLQLVGKSGQNICRFKDNGGTTRFLITSAGVPSFGAFTSSGDTAVNGYITILDAGGTTRKLATIA